MVFFLLIHFLSITFQLKCRVPLLLPAPPLYSPDPLFLYLPLENSRSPRDINQTRHNNLQSLHGWYGVTHCSSVGLRTTNTGGNMSWTVDLTKISRLRIAKSSGISLLLFVCSKDIVLNCCTLHSCLYIHRLLWLSDLIREVSLSNKHSLTSKLLSGQRREKTVSSQP